MAQKDVYSEFMDNQDGARKRLLNVLIYEPKTLQDLSAAIGMQEDTLRSFLKKGINVKELTFLKILNYIVRKEREHSIPSM